MNTAVRRFVCGIPVLCDLYRLTRKSYNDHRFMKKAANYFTSVDDFRDALQLEDGKLVRLQTRDGLVLIVRRNCMDAAIVAEIFLDHCYVRGLVLPHEPVVVDVGGSIGDFALYAAKILNARKVVVCEPSPTNWALLKMNIAENHYEDRIEAVNKAVTDGGDVMMNVDAPARGQPRVSAYGPSTEGRRPVQGITLASLVEDRALEVIDLLKIDCEGGEYTILLTSPTQVFKCLRNVVFEFHEIDGFQGKLGAVRRRFCDEGFALTTRGNLIYATRA